MRTTARTEIVVKEMVTECVFVCECGFHDDIMQCMTDINPSALALKVFHQHSDALIY